MHRPRYDDWSWPKGGVDPGEHVLQAAARELAEETGYPLRIVASLGDVEYERPGGRTRVHWWLADLVPGRRGRPDPREVDRVRWVDRVQAERLLSYPSDAAPLGRAAEFGHDVATILLVRHASAGSRSAWGGDDARRPLDERGEQQAARVTAVLDVFAPVDVVSADRDRCVQTVRGLAERRGLEVARTADLSDEGCLARPRKALQSLRSWARPGCAVAVCSQGGAIPQLVETLARGGTGPARAAVGRHRHGEDRTPRSRKGSVWVLSLTAGRLTSADYLADLDQEALPRPPRIRHRPAPAPLG